MAVQLLVCAGEVPSVVNGVRLSAADKVTLLALADFGNLSEGGRSWRPLAHFSAYTFLSERALRRSFDRLESAGLLMRDRRYNRTTVYHIDALFAAYCRSEAGKAERRPSVPANMAATVAVPANMAATVRPVPAKSVSVAAKSESVAAKSVSVAANMADYPVSYPVLDPVKNPPEGRTVKNDRAGTRSPDPEGFGEGAADAAPLGSRPMGGGGSSVKPATLHIDQKPAGFQSLRDAHPDIPRSALTDQASAAKARAVTTAIQSIFAK